MIELRVLGSIDLRDGAGRELRTLLVRPKQVALLAYLALREPRGWHQRASLLALFWPESDERRARLSLRNALYSLRGELGSDVLLSRGDDEVRLDPERLACDVDAFTAAIASGDLDTAMSQYRGPLLDGLAVTGLAEFNIWLDGRRDALRRAAAGAAKALCDRAESRGDLVLAVHWAGRLVELSPYEEVAIRRHMTLLDRIGDRVAAGRAFARWSSRLREELDAEPSAETLDMARRLHGEGASPGVVRSRMAAAPPAQPAAPWSYGPPASVPGDATEPTASPPPPPPVLRRTRARRSAGRVIMAVAAAALLLAVAWIAMRRRDASVAGEGTAVLPFTYVGTSETAYVGDAMAALMSAALADAGPMASIDPRAVATQLAGRRPAAGSIDLRAAAGVASALRAKQFVVGTVVRAGRAIRVEALLYPARGTVPEARATAEGSIDSLFAIADRVARELFAAGAASVSADALGTTSMAALRAYVQGERELLGARYAAAADAFERAVQADTLFARGWFRLSYAAGWAGRSTTALDAAARSLALAGRMTDADRALATAWRDFLEGRIPQARTLYDSLVRTDDRRIEAWLQLGELRFHWGAMLGAPPSSAADAFRHVLALAPEQGAALIHLARHDARELPGGGGFDSLARAVARTEPTSSEAREMRILGVALRGGPAERAALVRDAFAGAYAPQVIDALMPGPGDAALPMAVAEALLRSTDSAGLVSAELQLAHLAASRGRIARAEEVVARMAAHAPARAAEVGAWLTLLPDRPVDVVAARRLRSTLASLAPAHLPPGGGGLAMPGIFEPRRIYLIGALALRAGDRRAADSVAGVLERVPDRDALATTFRRAYARLLRASLQLADDHAGAAVDALGPADVEPGNTFPGVMSFVSAQERFVRAGALEAAGRGREALAWYRTFPDPSGYDSWFLGAVLERRTRLADSLGEREAAQRDRERLGVYRR